MSGGGRQRDRKSPSKSPTTSERGPGGPPNIIEFIDSQAPNTKSAIQRHTAQHAAAQRREAKLQALREGARPRNLQWQRRSSTDALPSRATAASGESSSLSPSPASILHNETLAFDSTSTVDLSDHSGTSGPESIMQSQRLSEPTRVYNPLEESILQQHPPICPHNPHPSYCDDFVANIRRDEASTYLLISYYLSVQAISRSYNTLRQENASAMEYRGQGQNILMQRLRDPRQASSDANIQAVIILILLVSDFGDKEETQIHINGLKNMVHQRGGLNNFTHVQSLQRQLMEIKLSRCLHLPIGCGPKCPEPFRFPAQEQESLAFS